MNKVEQAVEIAYTTVFLQEFEEGDVVATPRGERGVVAAIIQEDFKFPDGEGEGDENTVDITASEEQPAYIVGFTGESGVYRASDLEQSSFEDDATTDSGEGGAVAVVDHIDFDETDLPEGWTRQSFKDYWASVIDPSTEGGPWTDMVDALRDEPDFLDAGIDPKQLASDWKTNLLGTDRWRGRF